jgi:hypothetical protein
LRRVALAASSYIIIFSLSSPRDPRDLELGYTVRTSGSISRFDRGNNVRLEFAWDIDKAVADATKDIGGKQVCLISWTYQGFGAII